MFGMLKTRLRGFGFPDGMPRSLVPLTIITLITWATMEPILHWGFTPFSWNADLHAHWNSLFQHQMWAGELYPRWLAGMNEGLGSPVFFYYPPLPYWAAGLWSAILPGDAFGLRSLALSLATAQWLSGVGCYICLAARTPRWCAVIAAAVFMLLPYHLEIDLYRRGAVAEFWAFAWMPFVVGTLAKVRLSNGRSVAACAASYAALVCTHLPTTLLFTPVLLAYALFLKVSGKTERLAPMLGALACGVGMAAIYWLPASLMQDHASFEYLTRHLYYRAAFLSIDSLGWSWNTGTLLKQIGGCLSFTLFLGILSVATILAAQSQKPTFVSEAMFWWLSAAFSAAMMFPISDFIWRLWPTLQIIQYPWRWNTVLCLSAALLCGFALRALSGLIGIQRAMASIFFFLALAGLAFQALRTSPEHSRQLRSANRALSYTVDAPEYRPRWAGPKERLANNPLVDPASLQAVKSQTWFGRRGQVVISTRQAGDIVLRHFYFPGWKARSQGRNFPTKPSVPEGLLCLEVPPGEWTVDLVLESSRPERFGWAISVCSLGVVIGWAVRCRMGRRQTIE